MSEILETVLIKSKNGPVRVNKRDYERDQEGEKKMKLHTSKDDNEANENAVIQTAGAPVQVAEGVQLPPVPSAPNTGQDAPLTQPAATIQPGQMAITKKGKKVVVTTPDGTPVTGVEGIDESGYADDASAWAAIMAVQQKPQA